MIAASRRLVACALLALLAAGARATAQQVDDGRLALEVATSKPAAWAGEVIEIRLILLVDAAFFRDEAVQLFRRDLELPVAIDGPWPADDPGLRPLGGPLEGEGPTLVVDGRQTRARRSGEVTRDGRVLERLEIARRFVVEAPGRLSLPHPAARYARAVSRGVDVFGDPVVGRREEVVVRGTSPTIEVAALPPAPADFAGGVGRFAIDAVLLGEPAAGAGELDVLVRVTGEGDLGAVPTPGLPADAPWRVIERRESADPDARVHRMTLRRTAPIPRDVPPFSLTVFDTAEPAGYRTLRTAALRVPGAVAAGPGEAVVAARRAELVTPDALGAGPSRIAPWRRLALVIAGALLAAALGRILGELALRRARARRDPDRRRVRDARRALGVACRKGEGVDRALTTYLAACCGLGEGALVDAQLVARLRARGLPDDLAEAFATRLRVRLTDRFARDGETGDGEAPGAAALARALDAHLARRAGAPSRVAVAARVGAAIALGLALAAFVPTRGSSDQGAPDTDARELARHAVAAYERGAFERAHELFARVSGHSADAGLRAAARHDAALCEARLDRPLRAAVGFLDAADRAPDLERLVAAAERARSEADLPPDDAGLPAWRRGLAAVRAIALWPGLLAALVLGALVATVAQRRRVRAVGLVLLTLGAAMLPAVIVREIGGDEKLRLSAAASLHAAPDVDAEVIGWSAPAAPLEVLDASERWARVRTVDGAVGWVRR